MSDIIGSLQRLHHVVEAMEKTVTDREDRKAVFENQQDLFGAAPLNGNGENGNNMNGHANGHHDLDPVLIARKLDGAIAKVEELLGEG